MIMRKGGITMLLQFKFKNHKCFYDETFLDLMATQEKRHIESEMLILQLKKQNHKNKK